MPTPITKGYFKKQFGGEFLKSIACGIFSNTLDFILTAVIIYAAGHEHYPNFFAAFTGQTIDNIAYSPPSSIYLSATVLGFVVAVIVNYILSYHFVYKNGNVGKNKKGFLKFIIFSAIGLALTSLGSWIGYDVLGGNMWITKLIVQLIVFVYNFLTRKFFIFNIDLIRDDENTIQL